MDLDVICTVLGCEIGELLIPEPDKVAATKEVAPRRAAAAASPKLGVVPRRRDGRSLPPR